MKWSLAQNDYLSLSVADSDLKHPKKINDGLIEFTKDEFLVIRIQLKVTMRHCNLGIIDVMAET